MHADIVSDSSRPPKRGLSPFHHPRAALALLPLLLLAPADLHAGGYVINDQGSRMQGTALAGVATLDGVETLFYSPAGLADLDGWHVAGGLTELRLDISSTPAETGVEVSSARDHFEIPHVYVACGGLGPWAVGFGVNAPVGLATEWPKDYPGRFISRIGDMTTMQLSAMAAVRLSRGWSVGFGPTWTHGEVQLVRDVDLSVFQTGHQAEADLTGDGSTWGWRLGARWRGETGWRVGMAVHGPSEIRFAGRVDYTVPELGLYSLDQAIANLFQDGGAATTLPLPASAWLGVGRVSGPWTWEVATTWTRWSVLDRVVIDLAPVSVEGVSFVPNEFFTPLWHDAWAWRAGLRRRVGERWTWSAGLSRDNTPVPKSTADPLLPDSSRWLFAGGATHSRGRLDLDVAVQAILFDALDTGGTGNRFESAYDSSAIAVSFTAGWRWGQTLGQPGR